MVYVPAACAGLTASVAPTVSVWVPDPLSVPVADGLLVKELTVIVAAPGPAIVAVEGKVIAKV